MLCNQPQVIFGLVIGDPPKNELLQASKSEEFFWLKGVKREKGGPPAFFKLHQAVRQKLSLG